MRISRSAILETVRAFWDAWMGQVMRAWEVVSVIGEELEQLGQVGEGLATGSLSCRNFLVGI